MKKSFVSFLRWGLPISALLVICSLSIQAQEHASVQAEMPAAENEPVVAKLIAEEESIQPGRPFWVGVELKMADGWDTYWLNPGDSGFPTQVEWDLPKGFTASSIQWPYPEKITNESLVAFGYTGTVLLLSEITPPKSLPADEKIELKADVNWLACKDSCVPGGASLSLAMPTSDASPTASQDSAALFAEAKGALPQKLEKEKGDLAIQDEKDHILVHFQPKPDSFGEIESLLFIPEEGEIVDYNAPQNWDRKGEGLSLNVKKAHPETSLEQIKGVLIVSEKGSVTRAIQVDSSLDKIESAAPAAVEGVSSVAVALGLAFVGGLILNVMPCVLPVIALKIFGFVKMAHQRRSVIFQHGAVFSLGVLVSFWILSGGLLILRAYGEGVGWGFQLQEPVFVAILASILFLLGLSLFGVFELGTSLISLGSKTSSSAESPLGSSFMSGILATLVATPCTGPLLGPALGFAMTLPPVQALAIFTSMGLGMAFPYLLFSAFPKMVRFLPKPGNWMIVFKQLMGFLMMATVVWLLWVFGAQTDQMAIFILLAAFLLMAVGAWVFGRWTSPTRKKSTRWIATMFAASILFLSGGAAILTAKNFKDVGGSTGGTQLVADDGWEAYSPKRVEELQAKGVPVFVDFTAKWCLICQANKVVLHSSEVQKAFAEKGVVPMIADWTKKDPVITKELDKMGRTGVPVYVLYPGESGSDPYILPQNLSAKTVKEYVAKLQTPRTTVFNE